MADVYFNPHFKPFFEAVARHVVLWGSAGSSKSYSAGQKAMVRCSHPTNKHKYLVLRKFKTTLEGSVFTLLKHLVYEFGIEKHVVVNNTKMSFKFSNGNEIITSGLDEVDKLKSIHGITDVWMEEADQFEESDLAQINLRLRGESDSYKQIVMTLNPVSEDHWIKKKFFDEERDDTFTLWSGYRHNLFLDAEYVKQLETGYNDDPNMYRIYVEGKWGRIQTNEEFYSGFSRDMNVKPVSYNPELPIHLSFDFNVVPYFPMSLWQIEENEGVYRVGCFKIYDFINPYNNTESACLQFAEDFPNTELGLYIYGDASGRAKSTVSHVHNYDIIENCLRPYLRNYSWRVPKRNPRHDKRRHFANKALSGGFEDIMIHIDPSCELMITDFENVWTESTPSGAKKHKQKAKNKAGVLFERYGHFSDTFDYLLTMAFEKRYRDFGRKI